MSTALHDERARCFRALHGPGKILVLPNAWDAGSARLIESCGAEAIATTSSGVAWASGYPDGDALPPHELAAAVARIVRVIKVPLTVDAEGGYSSDPATAAENVKPLIDAGAVGINIEDGTGSPDLLCAKIAAIKKVAAQAGIDLFVNARTDVFLKGLVAREARVDEVLKRAPRYQEAGTDGLFVPGASDAADIRTLVGGTPLPVNVMVLATLPPVGELRALGVRRVSAGSAIAQLNHGLTRRAATQMLSQGRYDGMLGESVPYPELNGLFR
jgi:2-methylisocitrate lyase-like PEP mutase family enzyme